MNLLTPSALVSAKTKADQQTTFLFTVPVDLTSIFVGWGPLPAVQATKHQTGNWDAVGQTRTVQLSDGSLAQEQLTGYTALTSFTYSVTPQTGPLSVLVSEAQGVWWFLPCADDGTEIWWEYAFKPKAVWFLPVVLLVAVLWEGYMRRALALLVKQLEQQPDR